jgi:hypothetical protein
MYIFRQMYAIIRIEINCVILPSVPQILLAFIYRLLPTTETLEITVDTLYKDNEGTRRFHHCRERSI